MRERGGANATLQYFIDHLPHDKLENWSWARGTGLFAHILLNLADLKLFMYSTDQMQGITRTCFARRTNAVSAEDKRV